MEPHIPQIYTFLECEWNINADDNKNLILKSKVLNILNEILLKMGFHKEKFEFYLSLISSSLIIDEISEIYLTEVFYCFY